MVDQILAGPSATADWVRSEIGAGQARPLSVLLLPDESSTRIEADGQPPVSYCVLETPRLVRNGAGDPLFSLTLVLSRRPTPEDETVAPLIQQGIVSFEVTLTVPAGAYAELRNLGGECRPLFARDATFELRAGQDSGEQALASAQVSGATMRVALSASLGRSEALDLLYALDGIESQLALCATVSFRAVVPNQTVRLSGSWATVHDFLSARLDDGGVVNRAELGEYFDEMLRSGVLSVFEVSATGREEAVPEPDATSLFAIFMRLSSVILNRQTIELAPADAENRYSLRERPHPMFSLGYKQNLAGTRQRSIAFDTRLDEVIGGVLDGLDRSRFIHLVSPGADSGGGLGPAPRRMRTARGTSRGPDGSWGSGKMQLAALDGDVTSVALALRPDAATVAPQALVTSDIAQYGGVIGRIRHWWLDDIVIDEPEAPRVLNLPVVEDPNGAIWRDRANPERYWYAPSFEVVQPATNADPDSSPFLFRFERSGVTASGKPALTGTVRFTLRKRMSNDTRFALQELGDATAQPLPTTNLSVSLALPFVDENDGRTKSHMFAAVVDQAGDTITVTVALINDWVRLCYGVLAESGFQSQPARLHATYTFEAYVPVRKEEIELAVGGKIALTPIAYSAAEASVLDDRPYFDAVEAVYRHPTGEVRLKREAPHSVPVPPPRTTRAGGGSLPLGVATPIAHASVAVAHLKPPIIARPQLLPPEALVKPFDETQYATRTLVRQERQELLYPCAQLGAFYLESSSTGVEAIGCRDALQLGQTAYRQYEEIRDLAHPLYRVYRSLQQPGRFLILPATYRITRYAPSVANKAYRPAIAVYSSLDLAVPANNRVIFHATLQPDLPPYVRRHLLARLSSYAREPVIEYPTEVDAETEYAWTVASGIRVEPNAVRTPDAFQVALATDIAGTLLLRSMLRTSGIFGSVRFELADGSILQSTLALELGNITGTWATGPIDVASENGGVRLTNKIEHPVEVSDLATYRASGTVNEIVETTLAPGASHLVRLPATLLQEVYPVYSIPPGTTAALEEIRNAVEDIQTNVIFIDLVNYANHGLRGLEVQARMKGVAGTYTVPMSGTPPRGAIDIVLPLTTYLEQHILQFQATKTFDSGRVALTPWLDWDLETNGNVVSLFWEMIQ